MPWSWGWTYEFVYFVVSGDCWFLNFSIQTDPTLFPKSEPELQLGIEVPVS